MLAIAITVVAWAVAVACAIGAGSVLLGRCGHFLLAIAQLVLPWTALATFAALAVALLRGDPALAIAALVAAALAGVVIGPHLIRHRRRAPIGPAAGSLTVTFANVYVDNPVPAETAAQLLATAADVLVMTELTPGFLAAFDAAGGARTYPYRLHPSPLRGEYEMGVFTRQAPADAVIGRRGPLRYVTARCAAPGGPDVQVLVVHPEAPTSHASFRAWRRQLAALRRLLLQLRVPAVVIGDLNAASLQVPYRRLLSSRFRDAHAEVAASLVPSWGVVPWWPRWVPPVVARLDHLLVSPELEVSALSDLDPVGSDHRPFTARVQVGSSVGNGAPPVASAITEPEREAVG